MCARETVGVHATSGPAEVIPIDLGQLLLTLHGSDKRKTCLTPHPLHRQGHMAHDVMATVGQAFELRFKAFLKKGGGAGAYVRVLLSVRVCLRA